MGRNRGEGQQKGLRLPGDGGRRRAGITVKLTTSHGRAVRRRGRPGRLRPRKGRLGQRAARTGGRGAPLRLGGGKLPQRRAEEADRGAGPPGLGLTVGRPLFRAPTRSGSSGQGATTGLDPRANRARRPSHGTAGRGPAAEHHDPGSPQGPTPTSLLSRPHPYGDCFSAPKCFLGTKACPPGRRSTPRIQNRAEKGVPRGRSGAVDSGPGRPRRGGRRGFLGTKMTSRHKRAPQGAEAHRETKTAPRKGPPGHESGGGGPRDGTGRPRSARADEARGQRLRLAPPRSEGSGGTGWAERRRRCGRDGASRGARSRATKTS